MTRKENLGEFINQQFVQHPEEVCKGKKHGRAIVHVHTNYSDGDAEPLAYLKRSVENNIPVIAITDHNVIDGALKAQEEVKQRNLAVSVVVGEEIQTVQGHCNGLFLQEAIPMYCSFLDAVREIHRQKGIVVIPHMGFGPPPVSVSPKTVRRLYEQGEWIDALEVVCPDFTLRHILEALDLCREYQIAQFGANDCHNIINFDRGFLTLFEGETAEDFKESINQGTTLAVRAQNMLDLPLKENIHRHYRGFTRGLVAKIATLPVFVSTFLSLRREDIIGVLDKIIK